MNKVLLFTLTGLALSLARLDGAFAQANTSLSNLVGPTAVNVDLLPATDAVQNLGASGDSYFGIYTYFISSPANHGIALSASNVNVGNGLGVTITGGDTNDPSALGGNVSISGGTNFTVGGGTPGDVLITGGLSYNGLGGNIALTAGYSATTPNQGAIKVTGHTEFTGGSAATSLGTCGTSPLIVGNDSVGRINVGSMTTTCTINFAYPWTHPPICTVSNETARVALKIVPTTTTLVISAAANYAASTVLDYSCVGYF